ncbi:IclR family transcriptional regulator [Georgenia ruanii]|uniref:Helix-turn-helix domain-containing protein n=1 Tax=Georgenia ruanii TaxID=348442 RepID=A0A7J9V0V1_9MICO|nr:IclR family transcriptional regulator [Georgenia ruanii]MPV90509.1 helix-turn-helix domain-containing protein [Georgenia ruanii]
MTQPTLINSVVRALTLLDAVGACGAPVPAKRLAHLTDLPLGTTYHLLRTLVHEGYLERTGEGYVLGGHLDVLATTPRPAPSRHRSRRVLRQLHDDLGAAAYLAVLDDGEIRVVDIVDSPAAPRTDLWVGVHESAHATAVGKAVLAALPEAARRAYLHAHPLVDLTPHTVTDRRALLRELAAGGELVLDREEYALGTVCAAMPLPTAAVTGAVAVSVPAARGRAVVGRHDALRRAARLLALAGTT